MLRIAVERMAHFDGALPLPGYETAGAAGADLRASFPGGESRVLAPGERALIPTGLKMAIPQGYEAQIRPRSGLAFKRGLTVANAPGTIDLALALARLDAALPEDRVLVCDGGRFMQTAWERVGVNSPENFVVTTNVGAIGMGMGYAVGAAVARPDQKTLFLCGDGGFMMGGLSEFSATLRENLNMVTVICNDSSYGAEYIQFEDRQMDPSMSEFTWPSMAAMADAMGAKGIKVSSEIELDHALETAMSTDGPVLIELVLDPASVPRIHL